MIHRHQWEIQDFPDEGRRGEHQLERWGHQPTIKAIFRKITLANELFGSRRGLAPRALP